MKSLLLQSIIILLAHSTILAQALQVSTYSPNRFSKTAEKDIEIIINFDRALDEATLNSNSVKIFGRWSGPADLVWNVENETILHISSNTAFFNGEWLTVSLSKDIKGINGFAMENAFSFNFWIKAEPGTLDLTLIDKVTVRQNGEGHIQSYGGYGGDFNEDGYTDIAIPNELTNDVRMFLNDGNGNYNSFDIYEVPGGNFVSTNEGCDLNSDGHIDFAVGSGGNSFMSVFLGDGTGALNTGSSYVSGQSVRGLGIIDLDGDGHDDIVTANRQGSTIAKFMNNGDGTFLDAIVQNITQANGETAIAIGDANNDGILDVFVGGYTSNNIVILLNDGDGNLTFSSETEVDGQPWQIVVGDMNNDGNLDVVSCNSFGNSASVIFGDGNGGLGNASNYSTGTFSLAIDIGDIDGDGDLDLLSSNYNGNSWTLYENDGSGTMINERTFPATSAGSCAIIHDRDNDGDLDVSGIDEISDEILYFRNDHNVGINQIAPSEVRISNQPNPFSEKTKFNIEFLNPIRASIFIQNAVGQRIETLMSNELLNGSIELNWELNNSNQYVNSGVYLLIVQSNKGTTAHKFLIIK